jgi:ribosomal protein L11 methylase PrmA
VQIAGDAFVGSADAIAAASADLVVANINPQAIIALAPEFRRVLRPGGVLLASGFEGHEVEQVSAVLPPVLESRHKAEWSLVVAQSPEPRA